MLSINITSVFPKGVESQVCTVYISFFLNISTNLFRVFFHCIVYCIGIQFVVATYHFEPSVYVDRVYSASTIPIKLRDVLL